VCVRLSAAIAVRLSPAKQGALALLRRLSSDLLRRLLLLLLLPPLQLIYFT
jgi:hypothetical protein